MKNICERLLLYLKWMDGAFVDNLFSSWQEIETYKGRIFYTSTKIISVNP